MAPGTTLLQVLEALAEEVVSAVSVEAVSAEAEPAEAGRIRFTFAIYDLKIFKQIWFFYYDGFRTMTIGKKLWIIILIKIFILFFILRLFFFPDFLKSRFNSNKERGDYVRDELIKRH